MAAGTDIDSACRTVEMDFDGFHLHTLQNDPCVWDDFLNSKLEQAKHDPAAKPVAEAVENVGHLAVVRMLVGNPRAAVLLVDRLKHPVDTAGGWTANVIRGSISHFVMSVAYEYKSMNSLHALSHEKACILCADALRYAMCPSTHPSPLDVPALDYLVGTHGPLVDDSHTSSSKSDQSHKRRSFTTRLRGWRIVLTN